MNSLEKNFGYQTVYRILTVITPLITSPYLSRTLGAENLGVYSYSQSIASYFILLTLLGTENYGSRTIASFQGNIQKLQEKFWGIYFIQLFFGIASISLYVIFCIFANIGNKLIFVLQGFWLLSSLLDINWFFFGIEKFKLTVTRNVFIKVITVICIFVFVKNNSDLWKYTLIMSLSIFFSQLVMWVFLFQLIQFQRVTLKNVISHLKPNLTLFIPVLAFSIFHVMDKTMLGYFSSYQETGYYYNADKIINIPLGIITGLSTVMLPRMSNLMAKRKNEEGKRLLFDSFEVATFISCALLFGIATINTEFVPLFFGVGFEPCINLIYVFTPVILIKAWSDLIRAQYLIPSNHDKLYTICVVIGALVNFVFNLTFIPKLGAFGAVLGTLIAEAIVCILQFFGVRKEIHVMQFFKSNLIYILFGFLMFFFTKMVGSISSISNHLLLLVTEILFGACVYLFLCFIYWKNCTKSYFKKIINKVLRDRS